MFDRTEWYIFLLAALLIGVVYFVGLKSDIGAVSGALNSGLNVITGRLPTGGAFQGLTAPQSGG